MNDEKITSKQGLSILIMFLLGSTIILSPWSDAGKDSWISILLAMVMTLPMYYIYSRLVTIFPGKDLFDLQQELFGGVIGKITSFFLVYYSLHICTLVNRNISEFMQVVSLQDTPIFPIAIVGSMLYIWIISGGIEVIGRFSVFMLPLSFFTIIIVSLLLIPKLNIDNLRPVMYNGITPVLKGTASVFSFPFAETFLFTMVFNSLEDKSKSFKIYVLGMLISGFFLVATAVRNIAALGDTLNSTLYFPPYIAVGLVNIKDFIDRIEVLVGANFIFLAFLKCSICLYVATKGLAKIFSIKDYRQIAAPLGLMVSIATVFVYKSTMEMFEWASENYIYYIVPFSIILPIITWITGEFKVRSKKRRASSN